MHAVGKARCASQSSKFRASNASVANKLPRASLAKTARDNDDSDLAKGLLYDNPPSQFFDALNKIISDARIPFNLLPVLATANVGDIESHAGKVPTEGEKLPVQTWIVTESHLRSN